MKVRNLLLVLGLLAIPACSTTRNAQNVSTGETTAHFKGAVTKKYALDYLVYLPSDTQSVRDKKWPAIIFLHGSGERGTNVWDVAKHGPPKIVQQNKDFQFIVISPQCPPGQSWDADEIADFVKQMKRRYPIDPDRVYLTGLSMGGAGTWNTLFAHPGLFAAAVPICGRAETSALLNLPPKKLERVRHMPIWIFHGAKDPTVSVKYSEELAAALKGMNADVKLTIYPEALHDSWTQTYSNPQLYDWLLAHDRKSNREEAK